MMSSALAVAAPSLRPLARYPVVERYAPILTTVLALVAIWHVAAVAMNWALVRDGFKLYLPAALPFIFNGPDVAPPQVIAGGGADVVVDWMPSALASHEKGVPLVNISQTFKRSGSSAMKK